MMELPRMRNGETWLRMQTGGRSIWYGGDVFLNMLSMTGVAGFFIRCAGMGPGFRMNPISRRFMMLDCCVTLPWAQVQLTDHPPDVLIPGHGTSLECDGLLEKMRGLIGR